MKFLCYNYLMFSSSSSKQGEVLQSDINAAINGTYQTIAAKRNLSPHEVRLERVCGQAFDLLFEGLSSRYNVRRDRRIVWLGIARDETGKPLPLEEQETQAIIHCYPVIETNGTPKNDIIVDATWQQFLTPKQRSGDLPNALVGTRQQVITELQSHGITNEELVRTWAPRRHLQ
jgi:hypothetical protein